MLQQELSVRQERLADREHAYASAHRQQLEEEARQAVALLKQRDERISHVEEEMEGQRMEVSKQA